MRNPFGFFGALLQQAVWVQVWVFTLMLANLASLGFWIEPLAKAIFIIFIFSSMLMMGLYAKYGYEKILGLGHILWLPLLGYLIQAIPEAVGDFKVYLITFGVFMVISLAFDISDVWKYFSRQEKT